MYFSRFFGGLLGAFGVPMMAVVGDAETYVSNTLNKTHRKNKQTFSDCGQQARMRKKRTIAVVLWCPEYRELYKNRLNHWLRHVQLR